MPVDKLVESQVIGGTRNDDDSRGVTEMYEQGCGVVLVRSGLTSTCMKEFGLP